MKTKLYWAALLASAAMVAQANAGSHHGGGGGKNSPSSASAPAQSGRASAVHSGSTRNFRGGRMLYSGRRFSPGGMRQFNYGAINRGDRTVRFGNNQHFAQGRNHVGEHNGTAANHRNGAGHVRNGNNLPTHWQNHVAARHSANWHRDWDRNHDHRWHGHHCRFINGSWVIFDLGFYPWWSYGYPSDYYAYDYYPYDYNPGYYYSDGPDDEAYYGQNGDDSSVPYADSPIAAAQEQLAREGYYRGEIDGVLGPQTRRAIARYQGRHGLRVTGDLSSGTLEALGLGEVASD